METAIEDAKIIEAASGWHLNVTDAAWKCLHRCWVDKVYLRQLAHRFVISFTSNVIVKFSINVCVKFN